MNRGEVVGWTRNRRNGNDHAQAATGRKPIARSEQLIVEELGDELLIYDLVENRAHSLSSTAAMVWRSCDGETTVNALGADLGLDADTLARALSELDDCNLLEAAPAASGGYTRRDMSIKTAKLGAAIAAVPLIVSVVAPTAAQAVTETFCQKISVSTNGCGECHTFGCCCCEPPGGTAKPCHADCVTSPDCNIGVQPNCNGSTPNCKLKGG
jgi:hypothetical protein